MLTRATLFSGAFLVLANAANATGYVQPTPQPAPVPVPAQAYDWSGFYAGGTLALVDPRSSSTLGAFDNTPYDEDSSYGVFAGYLHDFNGFLVGAEVGLFHYEAQAVGFPEFLDDSAEIRARLGYAIDRILLSGSFGFATQNGRLNGIEESLTGMVYGVGADYALTDSIFAGAEIVMRDMDYEIPGIYQQTVEDTQFRLRIGFNF